MDDAMEFARNKNEKKDLRRVTKNIQKLNKLLNNLLMFKKMNKTWINVFYSYLFR